MEPVHSELARISALRVISRTSALHYKNSGKPLSAIAAEASADAVVEGQVVRSGDRVRVQVQLVGVGPERQLWTDSFDRDLRDVLALHSDVARAIAAEVEARLTPVEEQRLLSVEEVDPQAYDDWLRASTHGDRYNAEGRRECVRYGKLAAARDSSFAPTFALLAQCYSNMTFLAGAPTSAMFDSSKAAATAALELDDRQVQAMAALAFGLAHHDWDWTGAETTYRRALDINPSYGYARLGLAWLLAWFGKFDEAIMHARLAQRIDPVSVHVSAQIAMIYHLADRNDEALRSVHRAIELDTGFAFAYDRLHWIHHSLGDASNAVAAAERAADLAGAGDTRRRGFVAHAYGVAGRVPEARTILRELLEGRQVGYVPPIAIAAAYVGLGEHEHAIDWLEAGFNEHDGGMVLLATFSLWDPLRDHPRFKALLKKMKFPQLES